MRADGPFRGAKLVLLVGRRVVVLRRDDRPGLAWAGQWDLPGGGREGGERARATLARELFEETGLRLPRRTRWRAVRRPRGRAWHARAALPGVAAARMRLGAEGSALEALAPRRVAALTPMVPHLRRRVAAALGLRTVRRR